MLTGHRCPFLTQGGALYSLSDMRADRLKHVDKLLVNVAQRRSTLLRLVQYDPDVYDLKYPAQLRGASSLLLQPDESYSNASIVAPQPSTCSTGCMLV